MAHIYVLPDGKRASTMKEARKMLGLSTTAFRSLVKKGTVTKELSNNGKSQMLQGYGKDD